MASTRVAVVTGSNKGIGLAIVRNLCKQFDGVVYLTSRNEKLGQDAVGILNKEGLKPKYHQLDIDSIESINRFQKYMQSTYGGIDVLVNNAGMAYSNAATEPFAEQAEVTNRVNYFGTKNVSNALIPLLRPHARVVNISSLMGHLTVIKGLEPQASELRKRFSNANLTYEELDALVNEFVEQTKTGAHKDNGWPQTAYGVSKVAVSALTRIQQREMDKSRPNDDIVFNHVHPGWVDTDMTSHKGPLTTEQGAVAATWLALLPNGTDLKGAYIWHDKTVVDWVDGKFPSQY